jgi:hypothetical protein
MESTPRRPPRASMHRALTAAGLAGVAALFLPFAAGVSPRAAAFDPDLWRLAEPFFLAPFITAAALRWGRSGALTRGERILAYVVSAACAVATLSWYVGWNGPPTGLRDWLTFVLPIVVLIVGGAVLRRMLREAGPAREYAPALALQVAYLSNAILCLAGFYGEEPFPNGWDVGAWIVLGTCLVYLCQIALARRVE